MIVTVLAMATVQEAEEKDTFEFLKVRIVRTLRL